MPAAARLQEAVYQPLYHEPQAVLESRLAVAAPYCWGAFEGDELLAYILSHPWPAASPPPIGIMLAAPPQDADNWFVHDLAIGPDARGLGLGRALVGSAARAALAGGIQRGDLVAVQGAWSFWRRLGYAAPDELPPALAAKVAAYGPDARDMSADLTALSAPLLSKT
jgi:GNAT superfamily N-acetyltransferase